MLILRLISNKYMHKSLLIRAICMGFIGGIALYGVAIPQTIHADLEHIDSMANHATLVHNGHLTICKLDKSSLEVVKTVKMIVTAYSSTEDQTDSTPFITASGKPVGQDIIAINGLAFETKVRIPELYGDKIFIVGDRMHPRKGKYHADIWFPEREQAKAFGAKYNVKIEVLES